jgi:hypothetical protein
MELWALLVLAAVSHHLRLQVTFMDSLKRQSCIASLTNKSMEQMAITLAQGLELPMLEISRTILATIKEALRRGIRLLSFKILGNFSPFHSFNLLDLIRE